MKNGFMVIVGVNNLDESIAFYQKYLGCSLMRRIAPAPGVEIGFVLHNDAVEIELLCRKDLPRPNNEAALTLAFQTKDLASAHRLLKENNVTCLGEPVTLPTGTKMLRFRDPDGTTLALMEE